LCCEFVPITEMGHCHSLFRRFVADPLMLRARVDPRSHGLCGNFGKQSGTGTNLMLVCLVFPCRSFSTSAPYVFSYL
jgi:hypothetical protein